MRGYQHDSFRSLCHSKAALHSSWLSLGAWPSLFPIVYLGEAGGVETGQQELPSECSSSSGGRSS